MKTPMTAVSRFGTAPGPKAGLDIHFFTPTELRSIVGHGFIDVLPLRLSTTTRTPPSRGHWSQWEVIWRHAPTN
jgi:hypothetical protein